MEEKKAVWLRIEEKEASGWIVEALPTPEGLLFRAAFGGHIALQFVPMNPPQRKRFWGGLGEEGKIYSVRGEQSDCQA